MPEKVVKFSALDLLLTVMKKKEKKRKKKKRERKEQFDGAESMSLMIKSKPFKVHSAKLFRVLWRSTL